VSGRKLALSLCVVVVYRGYDGKAKVEIECDHLLDSSGSWFHNDRLRFSHWEAVRYAESEFESANVKFTLIYKGPLYAKSAGSSSRVTHEHNIRKVIHKQLVELWKVQYPLSRMGATLAAYTERGGEPRTRLSNLSDGYLRGPFRFLPLVNKELGLVCRLDILFLRRANPGEIVTHGGDLDNRLKTLFDALKVPETVGDDQNPDEGEIPFFFCLLEDDALITEVNVSTDRLLEPTSPETKDKDVHLVIKVETLVADEEQAAIWGWRW
jgi:hypothetical protein